MTERLCPVCGFGGLTHEDPELVNEFGVSVTWHCTSCENRFTTTMQSLCPETFGSKCCVLREGHGGPMHVSNSGSMWTKGSS